MLRQNGYGTAAFGKYHETPPWEVSVSGPFDRWPTRSGFDKFYGFIGGEANQFAPVIHDGTTKVEPPDDPNYHFTADMTNQAIKWMRFPKALSQEKPFFVYFATGATHAPHHVPKEWIAKYKGQFDDGWDKYREKTLARQIKLGIVPPGTKLAPKPPGIKAWDKLTANEKKLYAHQMEVFAEFASHTDHEVGRLAKSLEDMGEMDNTLFLYVFGDNGGKPGSGGKGTLLVNGKKVAEGRIGKTVPFVFSADETADVGTDDATPVTKDYKQGDNKFNGKIAKVTVTLKDAKK
jgi:arylsulfatase A-like enzyme